MSESANSERITVAAIACFEVSFEISTLDLVERSNNGSRFARMTDESTAMVY